MRFNRGRNLNKDKKEREGKGKGNWMQTYSDMVTLLLAFFVLLFTFASIDLEEFEEVMHAIQHSFMGRSGIMEGTPDPGEKEGERLDREEYERQPQMELYMEVDEYGETLIRAAEQIEQVYEDMQVLLKEIGMEEEIELRLEERGIVVELPEKVLFDKGRSELKEEFKSTLKLFAGLLEDIPNNIIIEGHTCTIPISTDRYPSNWELSVMRATTITRYFIEEEGMNPKRFSASGYGEYKPIESNETEEGRMRNRRVSVVISILGGKNENENGKEIEEIIKN